ncbi:nucleotidyltransferase domain-containing protein [bacterium]|nr:nucleotidyltransferase domain-containing protein [bacterium]
MTIPQKNLNEIIKRLVTKFTPKKIILFGSHSRDTADNRSDIDILTICPLNGDRFDLMRDMTSTLNEIDYAFDVIVLTSEEFEVYKQIPGTIARYASKEGKILYESQ